MIDSDSTEYAGTPPGTCFATRLSEESMGKAGGEKGSQAYCVYGENLFRRQRSPMGSAANRSRKRFRDEFLTHDHLHSPAVLLTLGGTIHERYEYDAYGDPTIYTGDGGDGNWFDGDETSGDSSALGNPYLFTGRRVDFLDSNDLVLQYNRNRYYNYYTGRWLTQDPLQYLDSMNLYQYVRSNPLMLLDALGLFCGECAPPRPPHRNAYRSRIVEYGTSTGFAYPTTVKGLKDAVTIMDTASGIYSVAIAAARTGLTLTQYLQHMIPETSVSLTESYMTGMALRGVKWLEEHMGSSAYSPGFYLWALVEYETCAACGKLCAPWKWYAGCPLHHWETKQKWHACWASDEAGGAIPNSNMATIREQYAAFEQAVKNCEASARNRPDDAPRFGGVLDEMQDE